MKNLDASTDTAGLAAYLDNLSILEEERLMWLYHGFYVYLTIQGAERSHIVDAKGKISTVSTEVATNVRNTVVARWEREKMQPKLFPHKQQPEEPIEVEASLEARA